MDIIVILHNSNSKLSRNFVAAHGGSYQVIDWYSTGADAVAYKSREMPYPRAFPSVVDTVQKSIVDTPKMMDAALATIAQMAADQAAAEVTAAEAAKKVSDAKTQVDAADFDAAKKAIEAAAGFKDVQVVLADLVEMVARLAEAMGMTPVTPAAKIGP